MIDFGEKFPVFEIPRYEMIDEKRRKIISFCIATQNKMVEILISLRFIAAGFFE